MTHAELQRRLNEQVAKYSTWHYEQFQGLKETISEHHGEPGAENFYQVAVYVLEEEPDYIHIAVSVDDGGKSGLIKPITSSLIVRREAI